MENTNQEQTHLLKREIQVNAQLTRLVMNNAGLAKLATTLSELSGWSVAIHDKRLRLLASHPSPFLRSIWEDILPTLSEFANLAPELKDREKSGKKFAVYQQSLPGNLIRCAAPISVESITRGYLSLLDVNRQPAPIDLIILEQGVLAIGLEMSRLKAVREAEKRLKGDLLTALLTDQISPRDASLWVQNMGLDPLKPHVAIRLSWHADRPPSRRRLETLVNGEASRLGMRVLVRTLETEIICFCEVHPDQNRPEDAIVFCSAVVDRGKTEYPEQPICSGVGNFAPDLDGWRFSFRQAGQALEMARRLNEYRPLYFQDLSVYRLLLQLEYHPELQAFKDEMIGDLLQTEGADEAVRTLETYFGHNGNLSQAAEALFIHRNTLIYRLERIAEITRLNFDNNETRLAIQLALRIHRMTTRTEV